MNAAFDLYSTPEPVSASQNLVPPSGCGRAARQEGGGVEEKVCFLYEEAEIVEFMKLMKKHGAVIRVRDNHQSVGLRFAAPLEESNIEERKDMVRILYSGQWLPDIVDHCPDRNYDLQGLADMIRAMA